MSERRRVGVLLFERFELLDVFGPLELYGALPDHFELCMCGREAGPVTSAQGPAVLAEYSYIVHSEDGEHAKAPAVEIVLVPGGIGTRPLVEDRDFLDWLATWAGGAEIISSVCTGSGLLAAAGLLDDYQATSNKRAFAWARSQSPKVHWVPKARWVADRNRWTSSGVAAGMDMTLALIAHLHGEAVASDVADQVEYDWHRDPSWDPFAARYGLDQDG